MFSDRATFKELLYSAEKIATQPLSSRLAKLLANGVIEQDTQDSRYTLTDKGDELAPVLIELARWVEKYDNTVAPTAEIYEKYQ